MWKWEADSQPKAVIVLVHSAYEHHIRYAWLIEQWRTAGFHVIMGDLPGHGRAAQDSKAHSEPIAEYEKAVDLAIGVAQEDGLPVFLIAHGLGATIAMNALSKKQYHLAGAIFTSPWLHLVKTPSKMSSALSGVPKLTAGLKIDHGIRITDLTKNEEVIEAEQLDPLYKTTITAGWYHELQTYLKRTSIMKTGFPDLPVLVQTGELDRISDKEYAKRWIKAQDLKEFAYKEWHGCEHDLFLEPEREDVFASAHFFIKNVMRTLGYVMD